MSRMYLVLHSQGKLYMVTLLRVFGLPEDRKWLPPLSKRTQGWSTWEAVGRLHGSLFSWTHAANPRGANAWIHDCACCNGNLCSLTWSNQVISGGIGIRMEVYVLHTSESSIYLCCSVLRLSSETVEMRWVSWKAA